MKNFFRYLAVSAICVFRNRIIHDLRARIYDKMLELPLRYHGGERKGDLLSVITNDMQVLEYSVIRGAPWFAAVTEASKWAAVGLTLLSGSMYLWRNREVYLRDM